MHCHHCYRLFAAVDIVLSAFTGVLWWIVYTRSESLIRLQFEQHPLMIDRVPSYKVIIRSIGSSHTENTSAQILQDIYHRVQDSCNLYYKSIGINGPLSPKQAKQLKNNLMDILELCTILILASVGIFMFVDALIMFTTRHGKASSKKMIFLLFSLHFMSSLQYVGASLELRLDPKFCSPASDLRPMIGVIILVSAVCKPVQIYVICHYFRDVQTGAYVEETESDEEIDDTDTLAAKDQRMWPNDPVASEYMDVVPDKNGNGIRSKDPDGNGNVNITRTGNATDIRKVV